MVDEAYKKAFRTALQARMKKLFTTHLVIYLVVNIIWLVINYMIVMPANPNLPIWQPWYPPIGWGICIVIHYVTYVSGGESLIMEVEAEAER
ncbi:MAG TPA: 2TM domain-containing protein [Methanotrichaceae archaeon]|nr:2TM domain-containing protein [Methanotrichaceae archaeon]